ncbi:diheme cytochrome c-553 [Christiangramia sabulilitoris]|uniref:Diheme cytochrome c-553 n=1 Tax=Christiangramia sabulilitoris TaxID=2583991 RepID=A0A550I8E4_9FLAO|nr:diheme cytochrome c-553 [Christiangramia sabulilitoris]TRO67098.1 diheme cytochrome c-553 [Christiangramia sabulilitoris]
MKIFESPGVPGLKIRFFLLNLSCCLIIISCNNKDYQKVPEENKMTLQDSIQHGEYLVKTIGCHDCHSPKTMTERGPQEIPELALSGYLADDSIPPLSVEAMKNGWVLMNDQLTAFAGPWGISYSSNITSDDTGIGTWNMERWKTAIRKGKLKGDNNGRMILPPMPWQNFAKLTDEDLESIFKYLKSTKPVKNAVPAPVSPVKLDSLKTV